MFYSHQLLSRRGRFGLIWIAAIKSERQLRRKDIFNVKISNQCDDIIKIILGTENPFNPSAPKPRFSLRMSAQLMYGLIKIFKRQIFFVYDDVCHLVSRLVTQRVLPEKSHDIDLKSASKADTVTLKDPTSATLNPQFGLMEQLMSESLALPDADELYFNVPSMQPLTLEPPPKGLVYQPDTSLMAPLADITMMDEVAVPDINQPEVTEEYPPMQSYVNLFDESDIGFQQPDEPPMSPVYEPLTILPGDGLAEVTRGEETPAIRLQSEAAAQTPRKRKRTDQDQPARKRRSPLGPLELGSFHESQQVINRKKHRLIIDKEIRFPKDHLLKNFENSHLLCHDSAVFADHKSQSPQELLRCLSSGSQLNSCFLRMFRRRLHTQHETTDTEDPYRLLFPEDYTPSDSSTSLVHDAGVAEESAAFSAVEKLRPSKEGSSLEVPSLSAAISFQDQEMVLEKNKSIESAKSRSRSELQFPPIEESEFEEQQLPPLNLLEEDVGAVIEDVEMSPTMPKSSIQLSQDWAACRSVLCERLAQLVNDEHDQAQFEDMFPVKSTRKKDAARYFMILMHFHKQRIIFLTQPGPFKSIVVTQGDRFNAFLQSQTYGIFK